MLTAKIVTSLLQGLRHLVRISKEMPEIRFLFLEAPGNAGKTFASDILNYLSQMDRLENVGVFKLPVVQPERAALEKRLNTSPNGDLGIRLDEVPRTIILESGKISMAGTVLGFKQNDLNLISDLARNSKGLRSTETSIKPKMGTQTQITPAKQQESQGSLAIPSGTNLCGETVNKLVQRAGTRIEGLLEKVRERQAAKPSFAVDDTKLELQRVQKDAQDLGNELDSLIYGHEASKTTERSSKPRRLYENCRDLAERCCAAEQNLSKAKNVADSKQLKLKGIGECARWMETMSERDSLEGWLLEECELPWRMLRWNVSSPLAHSLETSMATQLDLSGAYPSPDKPLFTNNISPHRLPLSLSSPSQLIHDSSWPKKSKADIDEEKKRRQDRAKQVKQIIQRCEIGDEGRT